MRNSLRCCLSCVLPCGALDMIRIVHVNGHVKEITRPVTAADVLKDYPNHVLTKPSSDQGVGRRILILSDTSQLKRGNIYFLIPSTSLPESNKKHLQKLKPVAPVPDSPSSSDIMVVSTKKGGHRRARRTVHAGDWRPILECIFEEQ